MFAMLAFCWNIEGESWFMKGIKNGLCFPAAYPLTTLADHHLKSKSSNPDFPGVLDMSCIATNRSKADCARTALTLLRMDHHPILLEYHIRMLGLLSTGATYSDALLAQHSVRDVTRTLSDLTLKPYDPADAWHITKCIAFCLDYLVSALPKKDGFSNVQLALQTGILPAVLRCRPWISTSASGFTVDIVDNEFRGKLAEILRIVSLYIIYPFVLRPFLASVQQIEKLGIIESTDAIRAAYLDLVQLATDRLTTMRAINGTNIDMNIKCDNCGKHDVDADFKACSGCFMLSYCSKNCQKAHWKLREAGKPILVPQTDWLYMRTLALSLVHQRRTDIVRVWKEEQPARTPLVCFDFTEDPNGIMVVGNRCLETTPGKTGEKGIYVADANAFADAKVYFRSLWDQTVAVHEEDVVIGMYLPQGDAPKGKWFYVPILDEYRVSGGTAVQRLIKTVEMGRRGLER
ncbi:hypothetical protein C8R44DRAFT_870875 [Mycena epipterygia]|nr:hypothetical protein C8R44DRAFT_870875 [Mycena epipterygia]